MLFAGAGERRVDSRRSNRFLQRARMRFWIVATALPASAFADKNSPLIPDRTEYLGIKLL